MPFRFNSLQRVKARCFARFASAFGCDAFSNGDMRISSAADFVPASSPARQISSANAAIFSSSVLDVFKWPSESTTVSPASARRTRSASHAIPTPSSISISKARAPNRSPSLRPWPTLSALTIPRPNSPDSESELGGVYRSVLAEWREEINTWNSLLHTKIVAKRRQQLLYSRTAQSGQQPFQPRLLELPVDLLPLLKISRRSRPVFAQED